MTIVIMTPNKKRNIMMKVIPIAVLVIILIALGMNIYLLSRFV